MGNHAWTIIESVIMILPPRTPPLFFGNCDRLRFFFAMSTDYLESQVHHEKVLSNFWGKVSAKQCK